ncbi:hypothetical protein SAMN05444123_108241 [Rhodopseudomonas pseudopalustris]|uniref:Kazal-type serine protease inhibitor domain-containing protein n=1 Tax=Rhodopseudomonas pseudopalustris TaxID=1513892 RepID=A0A1H8VEA0_9BRAD|nr:hypothetical protein SAMN05444123_108241 [Rhodopseudomonas pseudopalustris]
MRGPRAQIVALAALLLFGAGFATPVAAACLDRPPCKGCGCKGGPGYRGPEGTCVGFRELDRVCGKPPTRCVFENAPGTGANKDCALVPRASQKVTQPLP